MFRKFFHGLLSAVLSMTVSQLTSLAKLAIQLTAEGCFDNSACCRKPGSRTSFLYHLPSSTWPSKCIICDPASWIKWISPQQSERLNLGDWNQHCLLSFVSCKCYFKVLYLPVFAVSWSCFKPPDIPQLDALWDLLEHFWKQHWIVYVCPRSDNQKRRFWLWLLSEVYYILSISQFIFTFQTPGHFLWKRFQLEKLFSRAERGINVFQQRQMVVWGVTCQNPAVRWPLHRAMAVTQQQETSPWRNVWNDRGADQTMRQERLEQTASVTAVVPRH